MKKQTQRPDRLARFLLCVLCASVAGVPSAAADYVTEGFSGTVGIEDVGTVLKFDLSAIPAGAKVHRALLKIALKGRDYRRPITFNAIVKKGQALEAGTALPLRPPFFQDLDATDLVRQWVAKPDANLGLQVASAPNWQQGQTQLLVSYDGKSDKPTQAVTGVEAAFQDGQVFLRFKEIEDVVAAEEIKFGDFEAKVLDARKRRGVTYRVYRSDKPITPATLGQAQLVREVVEVVPAWNLKAVGNTEHPNQGHPTKNSPLRPGLNMVKADVVPRYRITDGGQPIPRQTGLVVLTITEPRKSYYAVTTAVNGEEAVAALDAGSNLAQPVDEKPSKFPATILQRTLESKDSKNSCEIYNSWIEPPYHHRPTESEIAIIRWADLPKADEGNKLPLYLFTTTYGGTSGELSPGWVGARRYVDKAFTVGLSEGGIWQGWHECLDTLKSYDQGVVHNYPQRRVLAAAHWSVAKPDFFVDAERVYFWSQLGSWALRDGDVFAVVMSNGYGNQAIGKQAQNYGSMYGPYPKSTKNWLGIDQWEYMDLPKWVRENPRAELPFWICAPAYGAYPAHTIGDFGFLPWPETIHAMAVTKRAFCATWNSNGPGATTEVMRTMVPRIRLHQSLPAFGRCTLDASVGDGDHADSEKTGGINVYQLWDTDSIVDEPDRWELTAWLMPSCPHPEAAMDVTPRRCQKFKAAPGQAYKWTLKDEAGKDVDSGTAIADKHGLVTAEGIVLTKAKRRIVIAK